MSLALILQEPILLKHLPRADNGHQGTWLDDAERCKKQTM